MHPTILALDLEGTLISNAVSQIPRPGLYPFLEAVRGQFEELVMFTTVDEQLVHRIAELLVSEGEASAWFSALRYITWTGPTKDLSYVSPIVGQALLLDDHGPYVHAGQEHLWVKIPMYGSPYAADDDALTGVIPQLHAKVRDLQAAISGSSRSE